MARLVIAIDCDDVLVPGTEHTVMMYNRRWGTRVSLDQAHNANAVEWATDKEDIRRRIDDIYLSDEYAKMEPYREAVNHDWSLLAAVVSYILKFKPFWLHKV